MIGSDNLSPQLEVLKTSQTHRDQTVNKTKRVKVAEQVVNNNAKKVEWSLKLALHPDNYETLMSNPKMISVEE